MKRFFLFFLLVFTFLFCEAQKINTSLVYSVHPAAATEKKPPVLIFLHGYGSNEADLFELANGFDPRFVSFSLRAPLNLSQGGHAWFSLEINNGVKKYNYTEAAKSRQQILSFISNACKAYGADSSRVYLLGFSQGAMMSFDLMLAAPSKITGIVALSGRLMDESTKHTSNQQKLSAVKVFIGHGTSDNMISVAEADKALNFLKSKKITSLILHKYDIPHSISGAELNDIKAWLTKEASSVKAASK